MILQKLQRLEDNITVLNEIKEDVKKGEFDKKKEWEIRYGFFESIQIVIDIACKLVAKYNLVKPKSYRECIEGLLKANILQKDIVDDFIKMVGFRNILIHDYEEIKKEALLEYLERLDDFKIFIKSVKDL